MPKKLLAGATLAMVATFTLAACGSDDTGANPMDEETTSSMQAMDDRTGDFAGLNGKEVAGSATFADGKLTLAGFSSDEGPDLHVYLTNGTDSAAVGAGKELGLVSYDEASQTFSLDGVDSSMYSHVVIHCDKAKAVFGAAELG